MIDLFIPCAPKDTVKLPFLLDSVTRYLSDIEAVHICTPQPIEPLGVYCFDVHYHLDRDVLNFDYTRLKFRPTWVYQQFLKLFQTVTSGDYYLVMDADKIINRPLAMFKDGQPILYLPNRDQNHGPYYEYSQAMLGLRREFDHSFLSELTLYRRDIVREMLEHAGLTLDQWLEKSVDIINATCVIGDAELYGNWAAFKHPGLYQYWYISDEQRGHYGGDWTAAELTAFVDEMRDKPVDVLSAHSWHD